MTGRRKRGEELPATKLTEENVREIRRLHRDTTIGERPLAARFGVSRQAIALVLKRETWAWVEE